MGAELYTAQPVFRQWMDRLDAVAASGLGQSVVNAMYAPDRAASEPFDDFAVTHLAIFMTEYALARCLEEAGLRPDAVLGASLGEFAAAAAAGALDPEAAVETLARHPALLQKLPAGGMLAVLGDISLYQENAALQSLCDLAAVNSKQHFVLSGGLPEMAEAESQLRQAGAVVQQLPVRYGFHSRLMDALRDDFMQLHAGLPYGAPRMPMYSCASARRIASLDPEHLWRVIRQPIRFQETAAALPDSQNSIYIDAGPSGTLAAALKMIQPSAAPRIYHILTPFGADADNFDNAAALAIRTAATPTKELPMHAVVFPGQGAQAKGMGLGLFELFPEMVHIAERVLGYSIQKLCLEDQDGKLNQTQYTQPALFTVNALSYLQRAAETPEPPAFLAGHSLGEYNGLLAAGVFDFETGLQLVAKRAELMAQAQGGGMAAVVGLSEEQVRAVLSDASLADMELANLNTPSQFVVAGPRQSVEAAEPLFTKAGAALYRVLNVSGAFHTSYMAQARKAFETFLDSFHFAAPQVPVIANLTARPYDPDRIKETLAAQINSPVQWIDSVRYLMGKNVHEYVEVGPAQVLTKLIAAIRNEATPITEPAAPPAAKQSDAGGFDGAAGLGSDAFKKAYGLQYAYVAGGMHQGVASRELVAAMSRAGMLSFYGAAGLGLDRVEQDLVWLARELKDRPWGVNLSANADEKRLVDLLLRLGVKNVETGNYIQMTPALVKFRATGLRRGPNGAAVSDHAILAKVSRPETAEYFLSPAPERLLGQLQEQGEISPEQAELAQDWPMADHLCAQADCAGHTDQAPAYALLPTIHRLRDRKVAQFKYNREICVGAAGGVGAPEAAAAAFMLGADFILAGSIHQCTMESGAHPAVKDMLQQANVQDTDYGPAGDLFELGAKVQVLRKGVFFPARAAKLYSLYRHCDSLEDIPPQTRDQLEERYFKNSLETMYNELSQNLSTEERRKAETNPKHKMALVFRSYCGQGLRFALAGDLSRKVDFQIYCSPAQGACNQWLLGTNMEDWRKRSAPELAQKLLGEAEIMLRHGCKRFHKDQQKSD